MRGEPKIKAEAPNAIMEEKQTLGSLTLPLLESTDSQNVEYIEDKDLPSTSGAVASTAKSRKAQRDALAPTDPDTPKMKLYH